MVQLISGCVSITGNFRENNEDTFVVEDGRYYIVADGMGGQSAGEKASELATELIPQKLNQLLEFDRDDAKTAIKKIDQAVAFANTEIMALSELEPDYHNMGTTVTFIVVVRGNLYIGNVGDSRVYMLRDGKLKQLTTDHSLTQALVTAGTISPDEAATHRYRNVLYKYLGTKDGGTGTEACEVVPQSGDRFMLCSDGVTDGIDDNVIDGLLKEHDDPQSAAEALVPAAEQGGSKDNITCVVVHVK
ncbi:MAG: protein phosphatase [Planctomycetaceae bacterium]|nr:protein phosphatase [Planctomycetaceae bacterium]